MAGDNRCVWSVKTVAAADQLDVFAQRRASPRTALANRWTVTTRGWLAGGRRSVNWRTRRRALFDNFTRWHHAAPTAFRLVRIQYWFVFHLITDDILHTKTPVIIINSLFSWLPEFVLSSLYLPRKNAAYMYVRWNCNSIITIDMSFNKDCVLT